MYEQCLIYRGLGSSRGSRNKIYNQWTVTTE